MQRRGVAPRRSASAGAGLRLGASANAAAGNAAHLGLDLLTPLALALGAAEVETQAKAARQIRDLAREGSVSCAAASKSGAVAALVALATRRGNDIAEKDERLAADGEKATRLDKATHLSSPTNVVCFWACARDAADALTALALADRGEGKQIIAASAKTVASLLAAVARSASDEDEEFFLRAQQREREKEKNVSHLSSQRALARRSVTRLVFALADTTNTRVALAENRDALSAFARDAGSRDVALAAAAAGVLWVAASPPETLQRSPSRAKDPNAEESTRSGGTSCDAGVGVGVGVGPYPAATAAAGDVADAIARRHLSVLAEAAATAETFSADEGSGSVFPDWSLVRRRVALAAASVAGRDAARAAAVSRETKLMACLVRSVGYERKGEERRAAATALWKIVSGVLRRRLASGAAARVIDALVTETDLVRVLAEALLRETTTHDDDDDARAGVMALARLASSTLGALAGCAAFARRVAETGFPPPETFSTAATETNASPLDAILSFAIDTVGTSSSAWALWCAREAASVSPGIAARCAAREGLAPALARAAAAGGDAGVFAAGLAWLCLTAAEEADDGESDAKTSRVSSGWEPRRANETETESAVRNRRRVVSAFARALSSPPVQTMAGSRTEAGAFLAATLRSMTARCVAQDAEAASTSGSTLGDSAPNHARGVSIASAESFQTGPASAGGGAAARASDHLARRYHERRRSRAASGELGFWGSQELDVPGDSLGAGPRSTGYGARETSRSSFGMLASRFSRGSGGAGSLGRNRDCLLIRLGPESRRLAAAIVSATVRALERDGDDSSAEALLRGDLPRLLVGLACDGDGDDDLGARFADPERALEGSSLGASVDGDDSGADQTRGRFGTVPRTIHASAAPGLDAFLRAAGRACAAETGSGMSTDRRAFDVLTNPGEGLLLAAAAILASRDAAASREVAESLADVLARHRVRPGTPTESLLATAVAGQPGVLDGLARAACYGLAGASKQRLVGGWHGAYGDAPLPVGLAPYEQTVARGGREGGLNVAPPSASAPTPASPREDPISRGAPMITVPLPATPKGADGAGGAEGDPEGPGRTESALARLILPPARDDGDESDDDDDEGFVSADGEENDDELPRDSDTAARRKRNDANAAKRNGGDSGEIPFLAPPQVFARSPRAATAQTHTHTHNTHTGAHVGSVPNSSLGPSPSPREASARRRAASWIPAGAGGAGSPSASVRLGSPRGHERAASVSGAALVSRRAARGSLSARDELWDNRAAWAKRRERRRYSSSLSARRGAAAAALRAVAGLVLADASGKIAARVADHPETLHALAGALASLPQGGAEDEGDERRRSGVSSSSRDEKERPSREGGDFHSGGQKSEALVAAAARAAASLAKRGERDRVVESVFFGSAADASGRIAHADYSDSGPGSFASAATALVTAEQLVSAESLRARHAERVLDALLSLAVAASSRGISSSVSLEHSSVAAAECLASFATHPRVAEAMAAHGKVFPQLVALAAPPHGAATAAPAADSVANALVASPPPPGSDAAETVWSVDAVEVLVKACRRGLELDHDVNNVERNGFPYGQTFVAAETNRAAASSLRLLAAVAMTAEDDASRADIATEPGVLGVVQALLNEERPEREVREERGRSRCLVLAGACRLSAELARTPAALAAARAETEMADVEGSAFLGGLLRALDTSSSETTVTIGHDDASYGARSALGDTDARVASMCALSRLAAADGEIARALASAPTFVSAANRAVAAAAAASRAGGGGGGGGGGASIPANETASDVYWLAAHAACALTACAEALRGRASADGVGAGIFIFPASPTRAEDDPRDSAVGVGSLRLARDLAELIGGGETPIEASHTETHEAVESRVPKRVPPHGDTRFAPVPAAGPVAPLPPLGSAAPGTLRARRGAAALALAVGDAAAPMGKQSGSVDSSTRRDVFTSSRASSLRARLAASLGAARLLRVGFLSDSGDAFLNAEPELKAGGEEKKFVVADAARAFLRAMSRFGGSLSDSRNDGPNDDALTRACTSAVIKTAAECLRALCVEDGAAVAAVVADDASGAAARALSAAVARINRPSFPPGFVSSAYRDETRSTDDSSFGFGFVSSPKPSARHGHATKETRTPSQSVGGPASHKTRFGSERLLPSRDDALAAAAALAVVVDVARRVPESVVAVSRASGIVGALAGFLDQASFARAREAAGEKFAAGIFFSGEERRGENSRAEKTSFFDVALPPPFAYPFGPPTGVRPGSVQGIPETNGASNDDETSSASRLASYGQTVGGIGANDARTVAADVFAAVAAVAPARVVAADSLPIRRAARGLAAIVAGRSNASAARTAAARALWSLCLAEGDGAAAVDAAPGAVAALAGALAETTVPTVRPYEDTTRSGSDDGLNRRRVSSSETTFALYAMRAAAAGALGAVFSGAAADSRDPTRALRCVNAAFDVEGASRGFADVARGGDPDGALAAAAAVAAATRVPAGAARVAADQALLAALCDVAGAEEKIDTDAVGARAAEALANLAAHTSSVEVLASSPAASAAWLQAATLLFASRQAETRAAIVGAARSFLRRTGKQSGAADVEARFARAVADRLADKNERLSTRVDAAGCATLIATSVYGTLEEPAFVEALVTAFRFVGDASAENAGETMRDEGSERDDTLRKARLRQLARLAATAMRNLCACLLRDENENGNEKSGELSADRLARAAKEAAGAWRVGGADAATAAAVAEALEFLARRARRSWKVNLPALSDGAESSSPRGRSGLAEAASAAARALVAAAVAGTAEPPGAFASPGSPASPGSGRSPGAVSGPSRAVFFAASAVSAIAALALAGETCVAAFLEDTARRDALLTALAFGARRAEKRDRARDLPSQGVGSHRVPKEARKDEKEQTRLSLLSCRALRALAGTNKAWAAVVAARCFDALIDRTRYAVCVANSSEVGPSARVSAADVDEISVEVEVDDAAATSENALVPVKETFSVPRDAARSAEALAASSLRRCLDFGALDEFQALALAAPGAGLLEGALACIVAGGDASRVGPCAESRRRSLSPIAARFALDGASRACVFVDVFDDDDDDDDSAEDIEIPPETARVAGIRTLVALASTSATAARAAASAALSFSFSAKNAIAADAGGGVSGPIAALAETARSVAFRDFAVDAASSERDAELAVAVCEAVAVLAGASRKARRAFVREEGFVAAFQSMGLGANPAVAAAAAAAAESLSAR